MCRRDEEPQGLALATHIDQLFSNIRCMCWVDWFWQEKMLQVAENNFNQI